jgi:hypothetical protein
MKTLVLFDVGGKLYSCYLDDLASTPETGRSYVFDGARYEYVDSIEPLGTKGVDRRNRTGNEKLLDVLNVLFEPAEVAALYAGLTSVSAHDDNSVGTTKGGLVTVTTATAPADFDHVLFVRLKKAKGKASTGIRLATFASHVGGSELQLGLAAEAPQSGGGQRRSSRRRPERDGSE